MGFHVQNEELYHDISQLDELFATANRAPTHCKPARSVNVSSETWRKYHKEMHTNTPEIYIWWHQGGQTLAHKLQLVNEQFL